MKKTLLLIGICLCLAAGSAFGHDVLPPDWRGDAGSMSAIWDSWNTDGSADEWSENAGLADPYFYGDGYNIVPDWYGKSGVEVLSDDGLIFHLDNFDTVNPLKNVRVQITVFDPSYGAPAFEGFDVWTFADGSDDQFISGNLIDIIYETNEWGSTGWLTYVYDFMLSPNPEEEWIGIKFAAYGSSYTEGAPTWGNAVIDQIVIDTQCASVPVPAAVWLLGSGLIGLVGIRRRGNA